MIILVNQYASQSILAHKCNSMFNMAHQKTLYVYLSSPLTMLFSLFWPILYFVLYFGPPMCFAVYLAHQCLSPFSLLLPFVYHMHCCFFIWYNNVLCCLFWHFKCFVAKYG